MSAHYPESPAARSQWILERRNPGRAQGLDQERAQAAFLEWESCEGGGETLVHTLFLTNRECPWRCLMCDLWRHTLKQTVSAGAIVRQIDRALHELRGAEDQFPRPGGGERLAGIPPVRRLKLYNSGSFFDPGAIPISDYAAIAERCVGYDRVIVECHPKLVNERVGELLGLLEEKSGGHSVPKLEIAMGLETVHPGVLERLNKRITVRDFQEASKRLNDLGVSVRVFLLAGLPWLTDAEVRDWAERSVEVALEAGAEVVSWIPLRLGNGAMDELAGQGEVAEPGLQLLEWHQEMGVDLAGGRARVFADTWDLERFSRCPTCFEARKQRMMRINRLQKNEAPVKCNDCGVAVGCAEVGDA